MRRSPALGALAAFSALLLATDGMGAQERADASTLAAWRQQAGVVDAALRRGAYAEAAESAARLQEDLVARLGPDPKAAQTLANVLTLRALAEHGRRQDRQARWHWHSAQALFPDVSAARSQRYGELADFLPRNRLRPMGPLADDPELAAQMPARPAGTAREGEIVTSVAEVVPPRPTQRPAPRYPAGALVSGVEGEMVVLLVVGVDGVPTRPRLEKGAGAPTLAAAGLEALAGWRFTPATQDGTPLPMYYRVRLSFTPGATAAPQAGSAPPATERAASSPPSGSTAAQTGRTVADILASGRPPAASPVPTLPAAAPAPALAGPAPPPPALLAAMASFFRGDYQGTLDRLETARLDTPAARAQGALFQAAASYSLYVLRGRGDESLRQEAAAAVRRCRALDRTLRPHPDAFSPELVSFFAAVK